jgi:hypothetical protein
MKCRKNTGMDFLQKEITREKVEWLGHAMKTEGERLPEVIEELKISR